MKGPRCPLIHRWRLSSLSAVFPHRSVAATVLSARHHASNGCYTVLQPSSSLVAQVGAIGPHASHTPVEVRAWINGVDVEELAKEQLHKLAALPIVRNPVVAMPDLHVGVGATVGAVVPTYRAIIPAAVGVDIGCGMLAVKTTLVQEDLPHNLTALRIAIEEAVPHGRTHNGNPNNDAGSWCGEVPPAVAAAWKQSLEPAFKSLCVKRPMLEASNHINHLGTLGSGNHFVEICLEEDRADAGEGQSPVWFMLHSGSRGVGARIGSIFIALARADMGKLISNLPDKDLAYLSEGTPHFDEYMAAVHWAQEYARLNREVMMANVVRSIRDSKLLRKPFQTTSMAVNCHHNYVEKYRIPQSGESVWLTRKGATSAKKGEYAVIPGSMGTRSYIVQGKGNEASYESCSHGAGRRYSRGEATRRFTVEEHEASTSGVECRKDIGVIDETPLAYKSIDAVMDAQQDLVSVVCTLKQVLCVKG